MADVAGPRINIALARPIAATGSAAEELSGQACVCRVVRTMPTAGSP